MASTYPTTPDTFVANVDGVDYILAADMNLVQDAIAAVQKVVTAGAASHNLLNDSLTHDNWLGGVTFNDFTDDTYGPTLWNMLHNGQNPDVAGVAGGSTDPFTRYLQCTFDSASSQFGIVQFLDSEASIPLRGQTVSISADLWGTAVTNMRMAPVAWTGTADTLTSDIVGTWGAGSPTLATNWAYVGTPASIAITSTRTRYKVEGLAIGSGQKNLGLFIWTPDLEASTDVINIARVKMEIGELASPFAPTGPMTELARISKYYWKTFPITTAPAQAVGTGGVMRCQAVTAGATAIRGAHMAFPTRMRATPTFTFYNPVNANAEARDATAAADCSGTAAGSPADWGFGLNATGAAGTAIGNVIQVHAVADARL